MKGQFCQADQSFRHAKILGKIMNELLQRFCRFFVALGSLQQALLQSQLGTRFFVTAQFFQITVISEKTCVVTELEPAGGRVKNRNLRPRRPRTRDFVKYPRSSGKASRKLLAPRGDKT